MNTQPILSHATSLFDANQWSDAAAALKHSLTTSLSILDEHRALSMLAICDWMLGELDATSGLANQMIQHQPQFVHGYFLQALVLHKRGELEAALTTVQQGLHQAPNDPASLALMCSIQWQQKDHHGARMTAAYLGRMHPAHPLAHTAIKQTATWITRFRANLGTLLSISNPARASISLIPYLSLVKQSERQIQTNA